MRHGPSACASCKRNPPVYVFVLSDTSMRSAPLVAPATLSWNVRGHFGDRALTGSTCQLWARSRFDLNSAVVLGARPTKPPHPTSPAHPSLAAWRAHRRPILQQRTAVDDVCA